MNLVGYNVKLTLNKEAKKNTYFIKKYQSISETHSLSNIIILMFKFSMCNLFLMGKSNSRSSVKLLSISTNRK